MQIEEVAEILVRPRSITLTSTRQAYLGSRSTDALNNLQTWRENGINHYLPVIFDGDTSFLCQPPPSLSDVSVMNTYFTEPARRNGLKMAGDHYECGIRGGIKP